MKQLVVFKPVFIFDATSTWQSLSTLEKDLMKFFASHSLDMETINSIGGPSNEKMYIITNVDKFSKSVGKQQKDTKQIPVQEKLKRLGKALKKK